MIQEFEKIIIGGVETEIRSYESALDIYKKRRGRILKTEDYLSAVFHNLGFHMRPRNFSFIDKLIPVENVNFDSMIIYNNSIPAYIRINYMTTLDNFLESIKFWAKGKVHCGLLLNVENTYKDKINDKEYMWSKQHSFDIKRPAIMSEKTKYWYGSDIRTSRLYNINPNINEEYFDNHIQDFHTLSKNVYVEDAWLLFIIGMVEPDSIMSLIRRVEMETLERIGSDEYVMKLTPEMVIDDFQAVLRCYTNQIYRIYSEHGIEGLARFAISVNQSKNVSRDLAQSLYSGYTVPIDSLNAAQESQSFIDTFSMITLEQKRMYVADLDLNSKERNVISIVTRYVDVSNLTKMLKKYTLNDPDIYVDMMKNLYILISQINIYIPNYIACLSEKMVISKNLFINKNNFALFNKTFDNFIFIDENYNICMCDIDKVGKFIKDKYHKDVRLVSKEDMGNKKLEKEIPDLEFEYDKMIEQEELISQTPVYTDIFRIDEIKKEEESYGLEGLIME